MRIILGSQSPARKELLIQAGIEPLIIPAHIDEITREVDPQKVVSDLSYQKLLHLLQQTLPKRSLPKEFSLDRTPVLTADTVVAMGTNILGKPENLDHAREMLSSLMGKTHLVYTGIALWNPRNREMSQLVESTAVTLFPLTPAEVAQYLDLKEWQGAAGGYRMQGAGISLIKEIKGCHYNVAGLPLLKLFAILREQGLL